MFAYLYVHEEPLDFFRRRAYYLVRATSCGFLLSLQLAVFIAMAYFLLNELSLNGSTEMLNSKIAPLLVIYGLALVFSIGLDPYWSVQAYHFHKEGLIKGEEYVMNMRLAKT